MDTGKRDPRLDPQPRDVLRMRSGYLRLVRQRYGNMVVWSRSPTGKRFYGCWEMPIESWISDCATATVVTVAGEDR